MPGAPTIYTDVTITAARIHTTEWNDGSVCTYEPWSDGHAVGFKITCNGKVSYIYLNPSSGGDSPDVFVYTGTEGDPSQDSPDCFLTPEGVKGFEEPDNDSPEPLISEAAYANFIKTTQE